MKSCSFDSDTCLLLSLKIPARVNIGKENTMTTIDLSDFTQEVECTYDVERYSVRDNGAVLRHHRIGKRERRDDGQWTFGKANPSNGYLYLSNVRIHRIVATAFHGVPPNPQYVVDHIDTNRQNNRPENLRWVTRLENALLNPVTRKKIELICGSIDAFLENPRMLNAYQDQRDLSWMRTVTPEEAQNCKERMSLWASSDKKPKGGSLGEWVYEPIKQYERITKPYTPSITAKPSILFFRIGQQVVHQKFGIGIVLQRGKKLNAACLEIKFTIGVKWVLETYVESISGDISDKKSIADNDSANHLHVTDPKFNNSYLNPMIYNSSNDNGLVMALTKLCAQHNWRVPTYFPCCPDETGTNPLTAYFQNLKIGAVFSYNDHYPKSTILEFVMIKDDSSILVLCEKEGMKPWSLAEITFENGLFVHSSLGSYFEKNGADKAFCIEQGLEWAGGDTFDDFC